MRIKYKFDKMQNFFFNLFAFGMLLSSVLVITCKNPVIAVIYLISVFLCAAGYLIISGISFLGLSYIIVYIGAIAVLFLFVIMMINIKITDILETGNQYTKTLPLALCIGSLFIYEIFTILPFSFNNLHSIFYLFENIISFTSPVAFLNNEELNFSLLSETISSQSQSDRLAILPSLAQNNVEAGSGEEIFIQVIGTDLMINTDDSLVFSTINPITADTNFSNFLHIQAIGQGIYTYGAFWLILTSVILLLAMVAPIFISPLPQARSESKIIEKKTAR
jgi:NADH-ubiquinone oxidoreductase chain 6